MCVCVCVECSRRGGLDGLALGKHRASKLSSPSCREGPDSELWVELSCSVDDLRSFEVTPSP